MNEITFAMNRNLIFTVVIGALVIALALLATPVAAATMPPSYPTNPVAKDVYQEKITSGRPSADTILNARYVLGPTYLSPGRAFGRACFL